MNREQIIDIIENEIVDIEIYNRERVYNDEHYIKNDAKIEILEKILRLIQG